MKGFKWKFVCFCFGILFSINSAIGNCSGKLEVGNRIFTIQRGLGWIVQIEPEVLVKFYGDVLPVRIEEVGLSHLQVEVESLVWRGKTLRRGMAWTPNGDFKQGHIANIFSSTLHIFIKEPSGGLNIFESLNANGRRRVCLAFAPRDVKNRNVNQSMTNDKSLSTLRTEAQTIALESGRHYKRFLSSDFTTVENLEEFIVTETTLHPGVIIDLIYVPEHTPQVFLNSINIISDYIHLSVKNPTLYLSDVSYSSETGSSQKIKLFGTCASAF